MGPEPQTYPPATPELAWCNTVAWIVAGIFVAMFVAAIVLAIIEALDRRRARRALNRPPVTRFVVAGIAEAPEVRQS